MKRTLIVALIATAFSGTAMATSSHECQGNSCNGGGQVTNTSNSNSSSKSNSNSNSNSSSSATGGNATATGGKSTAVGVGVGIGQGGRGGNASSKAAQRQQQVNGNNEINLGGDYTHVEAAKRAAASAWAAPLTSSNDTCMGSSSGGVATPAFGISAGTTWTDKNCVMLKNSRELWNMGLKAAALARMCMDDDNRTALEQSGIACPASKKSSAGGSVGGSSSGTHQESFDENLYRG